MRWLRQPRYFHELLCQAAHCPAVGGVPNMSDVGGAFLGQLRFKCTALRLLKGSEVAMKFWRVLR